MKDQVLKLCHRLKRCTLADIVQFTEAEDTAIETVLLYLEQEGLIQINNGVISPFEEKKLKNEKEKLQETENKFNTLNKLEDKEELIFKAIDDIKKNGLTKEELSRLFDKIVVFDPKEITKEQKEEYNLNDEMYKELYENGGLAFHLKFMYPQTITNRRL